MDYPGKINVHHLGMSSREEREKALAQNRGGVDIYAAGQVHQRAISADGDLDFTPIRVFELTEQWNRLLSDKYRISRTYRGIKTGVRKKMAIIG